MALRLTADNFDEALAQAKTPVLVDFYKDGCVPCRRMAPVISRTETEYDGRLTVGRVNLTQNDDLVSRFDISAAPTLVLFKDGKEQERFQGVTKEDALKTAIESIL